MHRDIGSPWNIVPSDSCSGGCAGESYRHRWVHPHAFLEHSVEVMQVVGILGVDVVVVPECAADLLFEEVEYAGGLQKVIG